MAGPAATSKARAVGLLVVAEIAVLGLWFTSSAVLAEMGSEAGLGPERLAWLATAVQLGFAGGAVAFAVLGVADRFDPRLVFCLSALVAAAANAGLAVVEIGGWLAICLRALTGAAMAGVYPVGMKIAVGWGKTDRALLVGLLVGALTLGSSAPHLMAWLAEGSAGPGSDWRETILIASTVAVAGGLAMLAGALGPHHARAPRLDPGAIRLAWTDRRIRLAMLGYLGHMWELYAFWAWVGVVAGLSFAAGDMPAPEAATAAKLTAFAAIALGALACLPAGWLADRMGRAPVAMACLCASGTMGLAAALAFGGPPWAMSVVLVLWGVAIIPDSALYSTMVADHAPPERAGSLMTLQTALGFLLTAATVQGLPALAGAIGWPGALAALAIGPALGIWAMRRLLALAAGSANG